MVFHREESCPLHYSYSSSMTKHQNFQNASRQCCMQMTWWCFTQKNMRQRPHTECSWWLTSLMAGLRNGALLSASLAHSVPKAKSQLHPFLWHHTEGGRSYLSWHHVWEEADQEATHCQGIGQDQTQAGNPLQTLCINKGLTESLISTENGVSVNSQASSRVWFLSMASHREYKLADPWQGGSEPGCLSDQWCIAVHTNHRSGEVHRCPTSQSKEGCKVPDEGRHFRCMPNHPVKTRFVCLTKNLFKRSSFVHVSKKLIHQLQDRLSQSTLPLFRRDMSELWVTDITNIKVHTTVSSLSCGHTQDDKVRKSLTLAMVAERYPQEAWIHVFSDGSTNNSVANRGSGILIFSGGQKATVSWPVRKCCCSNYCTATAALMQAASIVQASYHDCKQLVFISVICTISWSWHSHQPAPMVKKTKPQGMFFKDAPFTKLQEKMCDLSALPWWANTTAANRSWRKQLHLYP